MGEGPHVLMNGVPLDKKHLNGEDFEEELLTEPRKDTQMIQKEVYRGRLSDGMDVLDWLMSRENIMPRLNQRILNRLDDNDDFDNDFNDDNDD